MIYIGYTKQFKWTLVNHVQFIIGDNNIMMITQVILITWLELI